MKNLLFIPIYFLFLLGIAYNASAVICGPISDYAVFNKLINNWEPIKVEIGKDKIDLDSLYANRETCERMKNIYKYEEKLQEVNNGRSLEEIKAILENFNDQLVITGDIGVKKISSKKKGVLIDINEKGLIGAYSNFIQSLSESPLRLQVDDLINLRKNIFNFRHSIYSRNQPPKGKKYSDDDLFKNRSFFVTTENLSPDVIKRLNKRGYNVDEYEKCEDIPVQLVGDIKQVTKGYDYICAQGRSPKRKILIVKYPEREKIKQELSNFVNELNSMLVNKDNIGIHKIIGFAVQEFLLIHPFEDGNGRIGRLLGQVLFKKLTGNNIVFPESFHLEMNYSQDELAEQILKVMSEPCSKLLLH